MILKSEAEQIKDLQNKLFANVLFVVAAIEYVDALERVVRKDWTESTPEARLALFKKKENYKLQLHRAKENAQ